MKTLAATMHHGMKECSCCSYAVVIRSVSVRASLEKRAECDGYCSHDANGEQ